MNLVKVMQFQTKASFKDKDEVFNDLNNLLADEKREVDLICFSELFASNINLVNLDNIAEEEKGRTVDFFRKIAKEKNSFVIGGFLEKDNTDYYNSAVLVDRQGKIVKKHRKIILNEFERNFLESGNEVSIVDTELGRIGIVIGNDLNSLEVSNQFAKEEVEIIINLTQVPYEYSSVIETVLVSRVIDIPAYLINVSNVGTSNISRIDFKGITSILYSVFLDSDIFMPSEDEFYLSKIDCDKPGVLYNTIDLHKLSEEKEMSDRVIFHKEISKSINKKEEGKKVVL